jgi:ribonuclease VapC
MLEYLVRDSNEIVPFNADHARTAAEANARHGKGMGQGGKLNLLDLMVYAEAKQRGEPLLCTGKDFAASDALLHPACRPW